METYSVFYLVGGCENFICKSLFTKFSFEDAKNEVVKLKNMGYKSMLVKNGHVVGGYCSYTDFSDSVSAKQYYYSL